MDTTANTSACQTCRFWMPTYRAYDGPEPEPETEYNGHTTDRAAATLGQCRRYAPRPGGETEAGIWPLTNAPDWCGEWQ